MAQVAMQRPDLIAGAVLKYDLSLLILLFLL